MWSLNDAAKLREPIREFFDAQPPISIKVVAREDPNWERVTEVIHSIKQHGGHAAQPPVAADASQP
jgi:hypothetical protein